MSDDLLAELTLLDHSRAQRLALAERWPLILANAGQFDLAEAVRAELMAETETETQKRAA